jgi:hypothetical protein
MRHRSAITGQFVSTTYAKRHPKTTVAEGRKTKRKSKGPRLVHRPPHRANGHRF